MDKKIAIVTSIMGAYDSILPSFDYDIDKFDVICYTNMKRLESSVWDIRYVEDMEVPGDNARSSYYYKWQPHVYLDHDKYDIMVWVDCSFTKFNTKNLVKFIDTLSKSDKSLYIEKHPSRSTLKEELGANIALNKDIKSDMINQVEGYFNSGYPDEYTIMVETGLSVRKFKDENLIKFSDSVWGEISPKNNTKRDQLVFDYCMWKNDFKDNILLFTYSEKCSVVMFNDHPNKPNHIEKVLMVGPWLGELKYERMWANYVADYLKDHLFDKVMVGCRSNRESVYDIIDPDKFIISDPEGVRNKHLLDGAIPRFNINRNLSNYEIIELRTDADWQEHHIRHIISEGVDFNGKFNVYYNYYIDSDDNRNEELKFSLNKLIENKEIDNIYLVIDDKKLVNDPILNIKKVKLISVDDRPTYSHMFDMINDRTYEDDINMIINSDCFLLEDSVKRIKTYIDYGESWVLSRKELISTDNLTWVQDINPAGSQDAWLFKGKIKDISGDFTMGILGCDNKIALLIKEAGYTVLNPVNDVILYHNHKSAIRNYDESTKLPSPYLLVNSCYSYHKVEDNIIVHNAYAYNPYINVDYKDDDIYVCSVVTENVINEFLLFRLSMLQYHQNCKWILSTDAKTAEVLSDPIFSDVECNVLVEEQGSHRFADANEDRKFYNLVKTKLDIARMSMDRHGYAFIMDTDMIMLSPFGKTFLDYITNSSIDVMATSHNLIDKVAEEKYGKYNVGMIVIRSDEFIDEWESYMSDDLFFEQKPFELAVDTCNYTFGELEDVFNVAYWKMNNNPNLSIHFGSDDMICISGKEIVNAHVHLINDASTVRDVDNNRHRDVIMKFLEESTNNNHKSLYRIIKRLNNGNN